MTKRTKNSGAHFAQPVTTQPENIPTQTCIDKDDNVKKDDKGKLNFSLELESIKSLNTSKSFFRKK